MNEEGITYVDAKGRTFRRSQIGLEKLCRTCGEFWPFDEEFFTRVGKKNYLRSQCKACLEMVKRSR